MWHRPQDILLLSPDPLDLKKQIEGSGKWTGGKVYLEFLNCPSPVESSAEPKLTQRRLLFPLGSHNFVR